MRVLLIAKSMSLSAPPRHCSYTLLTYCLKLICVLMYECETFKLKIKLNSYIYIYTHIEKERERE